MGVELVPSLLSIFFSLLGEEELAIVAEARDEKTPFAQFEQVAKAAMNAVTQNCSIHVSRFVIIPPRVLPKTSRYCAVANYFNVASLCTL